MIRSPRCKASRRPNGAASGDPAARDHCIAFGPGERRIPHEAGARCEIGGRGPFHDHQVQADVGDLEQRSGLPLLECVLRSMLARPVLVNWSRSWCCSPRLLQSGEDEHVDDEEDQAQPDGRKHHSDLGHFAFGVVWPQCLDGCPYSLKSGVARGTYRRKGVPPAMRGRVRRARQTCAAPRVPPPRCRGIRGGGEVPILRAMDSRKGASPAPGVPVLSAPEVQYDSRRH